MVEVTQRPFRDVTELAAVPPDLIFAEADTGAQLDALASAASRFGSSALVFVGGGVRRLGGDAVEFASPSLVVLPRSQLRAELFREAGIPALPHASRSTGRAPPTPSTRPPGSSTLLAYRLICTTPAPVAIPTVRRPPASSTAIARASNVLGRPLVPAA